MKRYLVMAMLGSAVLAQAEIGSAQSREGAKSVLVSGNTSGEFPALPPVPKGKSTILGGSIRNVDPVRDQFALIVFGERPMKILFDERTQVYRDGTRIPLTELGSERHASVQTVLDGASVFALSVHILSQAPEGECQGRVLSFNPSTGELSVASALSPEAIRLQVPATTHVVRIGQSTFTKAGSGMLDLAPGALVSVWFEPGQSGRAVASRIEVQAIPGSEFILAGNISYLDSNSGRLVLVDSRDENSYQISFDSTRIPTSRNLHVGDRVRVAADYQSARYIARDITVY
jgi:hypothetical protein